MMTTRYLWQGTLVCGVLALVAGASAAHAQTPEAASVVVRAATVIDGMGGVRTGVDVVVRDGRIIEVRPSSGHADVDLGDRVLAPGLIDTHVHMGWYITSRNRLHQRGDGDD